MNQSTFKKYGLVAVAAGMSVSVLAGCGSSGSNTTGGGSSSNASNAAGASNSASTGSSNNATSSTSSTGSNVASNVKPITLKYSTVATPDQLEVKAANKFKTEVEQLTGGKIKIQIYNSGSLYGQDAQLAAIEQGNLDMTTVSAATLAPQVPTLGMFTAAYTFKNFDAMNKVLNGSIGQGLFQQVAQKTNVLPLEAWYLGSRELNYRNIGHDVKTPQDMKGVKLRMPDAPAWLDLGKSLGAKPVPLSFNEVYTSLQTGTVDAQDNPLTTDKADKFYEVAKNISLTNHVVDSLWPAINYKTWQKLTPNEQADMMKAISDAGTWMDTQTQDQEKSLVAWFQQNGVTIVHPDINAFYTYAQNWYKSHPSATKGWDMSIDKQIQQINNSEK